MDAKYQERTRSRPNGEICLTQEERCHFHFKRKQKKKYRQGCNSVIAIVVAHIEKY